MLKGIVAKTKKNEEEEAEQNWKGIFSYKIE